MSETNEAVLRIEKMIYGGAGLARAADGRAVFVPLTLPGERVAARITEQKKGYAQAEVLEVLEPAPERTAPKCQHFGICGGCSYQHTGYENQLAIKRGILQETLGRAGVSAPNITIHSAEPWVYRNRIRMHFLRENGELRLGYKQRRSNNAFAVNECPIAAPLLVAAAKALCSTLDDHDWADDLREAEFFCDDGMGLLQIALLSARGTKADLADVAAALQQKIPQLRGMGLYQQSADAAALPRELAHWGAEALEIRIGEHSYRVTRGAFFQVNRYLAPQLAQLATEGRSGALVWDLYAGAGLFSLPLAKHFARVVAVEAATPAIRDLQHNLALAGEQHRALENTTLDFLRNTAKPSSKKPPQLIVLDPPRAGLGSEVCALLAQVGAPEQLAYVSCDPVTLSRDLAALIESGYQLQAMHMLDLFPQTFHMETVSFLRKM